MPCNLNQRRLAEFVKEGIRAAGGTPMEFGTISDQRRRVDGHRGHEGVAHLAARSSRTPSSSWRGATCSTASSASSAATRRSRPGRWRSGRLDIPGLVLYNGTIMPGTYKGKPADVVTVFEAIGAYRAGKITLEDLYEAENGACPGAGACGGQFTANTMSTVMEFLGLSPAGLNGIPAEDPEKDEAARKAGELVMTLVHHDIRPVATSSPAAPSRTRSPSVVGHRRQHQRGAAHAGDRGRVRHRADARRLRARSSTARRSSRDMRPGGRYAASDMYEAGGVALVMRELLKRDLLHGDAADGRRAHDREDRRRRRRDAGPAGGPARSRPRSRRPAAWRSSRAARPGRLRS